MHDRTTTSRRGFVRAATGLLALPALRLRAQDAPPAPPARDPPFRVSLAQWSFNRALKKKELDPLDFPKIATGFGIRAVEYVNTFYKDHAKDAAHFAELKKRCTDLGVRSLLIMCDGEGLLGAKDEKARAAAVDNHHKWVDAAASLGCHSIRVNAHGEGDPDEIAKRVAGSLNALAGYADKAGLNVLVENHGGVSCDGAWVEKLMKLADHPRVGTLPDFGNFKREDGSWADRYAGVEAMMPYAKAVSAKSNDFDEKGEETKTDYHRMLKIVHAAGYSGHLGIEYEGEKLSERDGVKATLALIEKVMAELS